MRPLPNKVKKSKIINDRRKVADLSESIDMVINIFPKTKELTRIQIEPQAMDYFARILESSSKTEGGCPNN